MKVDLAIRPHGSTTCSWLPLPVSRLLLGMLFVCFPVRLSAFASGGLEVLTCTCPLQKESLNTSSKTNLLPVLPSAFFFYLPIYHVLHCPFVMYDSLLIATESENLRGR